jgi:uncharacterized membrane protein YqaE (UPF0057 family)
MKDTDAKNLAILIVTVFIPPLGVALKRGFGLHFWINLALTIFGFFFAGLVHGLYMVLTSDSKSEDS